MLTRPFHTFREEQVSRFTTQIREAWRGSEPPPYRRDAVPHQCDECDDLWKWLESLRGNAIDASQIGYGVPWSLLTAGAAAHVLGICLLSRLLGGEAPDFEDAFGRFEDSFGRFRDDARFASLFEALTPRQRWCVLKITVWSYLERPVERQLELAVRLRRAMGYHVDWPRPRLRPQT